MLSLNCWVLLLRNEDCFTEKDAPSNSRERRPIDFLKRLPSETRSDEINVYFIADYYTFEAELE